MTRKDFEAVAYALYCSAPEVRSRAARLRVVQEMASALATTNPYFCRQRFLDAAMDGMDKWGCTG